MILPGLSCTIWGQIRFSNINSQCFNGNIFPRRTYFLSYFIHVPCIPRNSLKSGGKSTGIFFGLLAKKPGSQQLLIQKCEFSTCVNTTPKPERVFAQNLPRFQTKAAINWVKQQPVTRRLWVERRVNLKTRAKSTKICNCAKKGKQLAQTGEYAFPGGRAHHCKLVGDCSRRVY